MSIHPTSIVSEDAEIADGVTIGPYSIIRGKVRIGAGTKVENHVSIGFDKGIVEIGENNHFYPGSVVGFPPQDHKYSGEDTKVIIGSNNTIREGVTINLGTVGGGGQTRLGDNNLIMSYVHFGHDTVVGSHVDVATGSHFGGHCEIGDHVKVGGMCGLAQFTRVGDFAYIGGASSVNKDILPYSIAQGNWAVCRATNRIGLERRGFDEKTIRNIHRALRSLIKGSYTTEEALNKIEQECEPLEEIKYLVQFVRSSERGLAK